MNPWTLDALLDACVPDMHQEQVLALVREAYDTGRTDQHTETTTRTKSVDVDDEQPPATSGCSSRTGADPLGSFRASWDWFVESLTGEVKDKAQWARIAERVEELRRAGAQFARDLAAAQALASSHSSALVSANERVDQLTDELRSASQWAAGVVKEHQLPGRTLGEQLGAIWYRLKTVTGDRDRLLRTVDQLTGENARLRLRAHVAERQPGRRYDQCDGTCTVDCGHCKGAGRPVLGDVAKCPRCGGQSRSYSRGCSQCGHGRPVLEEPTRG